MNGGVDAQRLDVSPDAVASELCSLLSNSRDPRCIEACDDLIRNNSSIWAKQAGPDGNPILCHALAADNPRATTQLLLCGCDPMASMPDGSEAVWEWAHGMPHRNRAVDTLASFVGFKESLPVELMLLPFSSDHGEAATEASMAAIKAMGPSDTVVLYHGTMLTLPGLANAKVDDMVDFQRQGLQQRCGPTLSVEPADGFWLGVGFKVELPRSQVSLAGEQKPDALVHIDDRGVGWINTPDQKLDFNKVKGTPMVSLSMLQWVKREEDYGELVDGAEKLTRQAELTKSPIQRDELNRKAGQEWRLAYQNGRFGDGAHYQVEETPQKTLAILAQMAQVSSEQKMGMDMDKLISNLSKRRATATWTTPQAEQTASSIKP